jgi:antitoxin (DNA-binding transcriptional repressor) of toxin-antitoxin stability system
MQAMKKVGIAELKSGLSAVLAEVRNGARVMVCDRATPIAWLVPYAGEDDVVIVPAKAAPIPLKAIKPVKLRRRLDVVALLRESRDQR